MSFYQPLEQFIIIILFWYKQFPISTVVLYLFFLLFITIFIFSYSLRYVSILGNNWQLFLENYFKFVFSIQKQQLNFKGQQYFPFIFGLFHFILISNLLGMMLYSFTITSHIIITFTLSFTVFIGIVFIGFSRQGVHFLSIFLPKGAPKLMVPLLIIIEIISFLSRPFSLGIRLFANMMSGHTLLFILSNFILIISEKFIWIVIIPLILIIIIVGLELAIAILQAYVFVVLTTIYLQDCLYGH